MGINTDENPIIVENIGKAYRVSHKLKRNTHPTLKEDLLLKARKPLEFFGAKGGVTREQFWALRRVSFEIKQGDVVGLIGKNGSGKSTMLKLISRITKPTEGRIELTMPPSSLLEVGTGFHPELSGRENVYFNGAILGMTRPIIDKKFDQIVEFSGVKDFIETPVKFYSSGMKVRLAFSVAAHLDPQILLIDEVLAVGDINFKKKSLQRTKEIADSGATVLFVSHQINQLKAICKRGIVLDSGSLVLDADIDTAIERYIELNEEEQADTAPDETAPASGSPITLTNAGASSTLKSNLPSLITAFTLANHTNSERNAEIKLKIIDPFDYVIHRATLSSSNRVITLPKRSTVRAQIQFDNIPLPPGEYKIQASVYDADSEELLDASMDRIGFNVDSYEYLDFVEEANRNLGLLLPFSVHQEIKD